MRLDQIGLLVGLRLLLGLAEFLDQAHGLALQAAVESAAGAGVDHVAELLRREVEEPEAGSLAEEMHEGQSARGVLVKVDATVGELAERPLLLELCVATD